MKADAVQITKGVYWVGVLDWDIRTYHGYMLHDTTNNAFLVFGKGKVALIDNAYPRASAQLWGRIEDAFEREGAHSPSTSSCRTTSNSTTAGHVLNENEATDQCHPRIAQ
jgi:hypothetical protein